MPEDTELLHRYVADRSEAAFAELVRRHINLVYSVALRRVNGQAHLAEDVTQSVFTDLARKAPALIAHTVVPAWLFTSARYAAAQVMRTERRRQLREQEAHTMHELRGDESSPADWDRLRPVLDDVLDQLDAREREAVLLRFYEGQPFAEVGAALHLTDDAARMRVDRALEKLRGLLAKRGVASTAAALAVALANQAGVAAPAGLAANVTGAALTGATAAGGAAGLGALLGFMSTTKITIGVVSALAVAAIGTALYEAAAAKANEQALAGALQQQTALQAKLRDTEVRLAAETKRAEAADEDNAKLLSAFASAKASDEAAQAAAANAVVTPDVVRSRYRHAQELVRKGNWEAALPEFLWCYDDGMARFDEFRGVRSSFLLSDLGKLAQNYPPALAGLQERRDRAQRRMQGNALDFQAAREYSAINQALGDDAVTLKYYDELPETDARRRGLASLSIYRLLVDKQRYADAVQAQPYDRMVSLFTTTSTELSQRLPGAGVSSEAVATIRRSEVASAARYVEALAGAGDLVHAREFADRVLAFEGSAESRAVLQQSLTRAGHPELLTTPAK